MLTRPRVLRERAAAAAGVTATARILPTDRPGGRITGLSRAGVAVGVEGRGDRAPTAPDARRAVRWNAEGTADRPVPLPAAPGAPTPVIGAGGVIAFTAPLDRGAAAGTAPSTPALTTVETADGVRPAQSGPAAASVLSVVDVDARGRVLVTMRPRGQADAGSTASPAALWSPRAGRLVPLPVSAGLLLDDGGVVGQRLPATAPADAPRPAPALWRRGDPVVDLQVPGGWEAEPRAGNRGVVVGKVTRMVPARPPGEQPAAAVTWRGGRIGYLPSLGGRQSIAVAVNSRGVVAGSSQTGDGWPHAVIWRDGRVQDLGTLGGAGGSLATGVSDTGVVAGVSTTTTGTWHAVAWVHGGIVDLGAAAATAIGEPAARSLAEGVVNDRVYGTVTGADGIDRPVIWTLSRG